jgi:DNA polymerase-3 subunit gamma/tau
MRDALSILERCIQDGENNIDENKIKDLVGIPKRTYIHGITQEIVEYNIDKALEVMQIVLDEGKDLNNLLWEIIKYIKDILVYKSNGKLDLYSEEELGNIKNVASKLTKERAINLIYELSNLSNDMKNSTQRVIVFEAGIIKLCNKTTEKEVVSNSLSMVSNNFTMPANNELEQRLSKLERYVSSVNFQGGLSTNRTQKVENSSKNTIKASIKVPLGKTQEYWPQIVNDLKKNGKIVLYTNLMHTVAREINEKTIGIEFPKGLTSFGKTVLEKQDNLKELTDLVSSACGKDMQIKYIEPEPEEIITREQEISNFANGNGIPFSIT